jgi:hypothetical protein
MTKKTIFAEVVIRKSLDAWNPYAFFIHRELVGTGGYYLRSLICEDAANKGRRVYDAINEKYLVGTVDQLDHQ